MPPDLLTKLCALHPCGKKTKQMSMLARLIFFQGVFQSLWSCCQISSAPTRRTCKDLETLQVNLVCLSPPACQEKLSDDTWGGQLQITGWRWLQEFPMASASSTRELCAVSSEHKASSTCECQEVPDIWRIYALIVHMNIKSQGAWTPRNKSGSVGACRTAFSQSQIPLGLNWGCLPISCRTIASLFLESSLDLNQAA